MTSYNHNKQISLLNTQYAKLQNRIDQVYIDKLDGKIEEDFYTKKVSEWRDEQKSALEQIDKHQNANANYFDEGVKILELAQKAYSLYVRQSSVEKRRLLNYLLSNCTLDDVTLYPTYRKPFDMLVKTAGHTIGGGV